MKNVKPFLLGCIAGCGIMFVALQYHVVQSHDGMQLVPRAPQATLGLAWVDVRDWDARTWSDRPEIARALVAHGSSDLITESVAREIADSGDPDQGTIGRLRSLLNTPMSTDLDAPAFEDDSTGLFHESDGDSPVIPFPNEANKTDWDDLFTNSWEERRPRTNVADRRTRHSETNTDFDFGFGEKPGEPAPYQRRLTDPLSDAESLWKSETKPKSSSKSTTPLFRETTILEDLFLDERDPVMEPASVSSRSRESGFESMARALESRATRALNRAGSGIRQSDTPPVPDGYRRNSGVSGWSKSTVTDDVPDAVRALREGYDPFS